jgi:RTX calcium-binding nonapeptide repeat (4 copies)
LIAATGISTSGVAADADRVALLDRITGTDKANVLRGTAKSDVIDGRAGNDVLYGRAGDDRLIGGPGADEIFCGRGRDNVSADRRDSVARDCEVVRGGVPPPPPRVVPEQLLGVWNRTVTDPNLDAAFHGVWSLRFDRMGFLEIYEPVGRRLPGVRDKATALVSATADGQLEIGATPRCLTTGIYGWELANTTLRIQRLSDACNRAFVLAGDWAR